MGGARRLLLVTAVCVALGAPGARAVEAGTQASASSSGVRRAELRIDTSRVGDAGPVIKRRVEERGGVVLRDAGVLAAADGEDPRIFVVVMELRGEDPGYAFELWIEQRGQVLGERRTVECTLCTESEIVGRVEEALAEALPRLPEAGADASDSAGPEPGSEAPGPVGPAEVGPGSASDGRDREALGPKGKAGVGLLATGVVAVGVGIGLAVPPPRVRRSDPRYVTDTRPPGIVAIASGGAAVVVGAVLLALDRRQRRPTVAVVPWLRRHGAGVGAVVRF